MKPSKPDLELIFLNFNSDFWIEKALVSLQNHYLKKTRLQVSVTVVDNASSDNSLATVRACCPKAKIIQLDKNKGFAEANNQALKQTEARYTMLLNSDVELTPKSNFDELVSYMDSHSKVGIITPALTFFSGKLDPASHRGEPTLWASFAYFARLEQLFPNSVKFGQYHLTHKNLDEIHEIDACSGAALLSRTSLYKKVGLLDEQFFMYAEDLDWCKRFREAGYKVFFHPGVTLIHHKYKSGIKQTSQSIAQKTQVHFYNTMLQYYDKHYAKRYPTVVRWLLKYFLALKKGGL
ncbi:MAG: glycosyltransferase family 2 protein [bacterium]|nr:glycosyltransferase family 2 protein [bacterium]